MIYVRYPDFPRIFSYLVKRLKEARLVEQERWQGMDVKNDPSARIHEIRNVCFEADLGGTENLYHWKEQIRPNLPWADDHFAERVGGHPLNPGIQWKNWPWAGSADRFRDSTEKFNITYMERLWPKYVGYSRDGILPLQSGERGSPSEGSGKLNRGVFREVGDLQDLIELLVREPSTRQAWIPLFFPDDTGWGDGGRKMCSLGYNFLRRSNRLHLWYPLRSCDYTHHLRDDCYLAIRILIWVLERCRVRDGKTWDGVKVGTLGMHMTSLHVFENDWRNLR